MKKLLFLLPALFLFLSACSQRDPIPCLTDGSCCWDAIEEIRIYSDGYYGRTLEDPLVITDSQTIEKLLDAALDAARYRPVPDGQALEGLNGLWVDFGNGAVLGMYADENYGSFSDGIEPNGSPCYRLPNNLCRRIRSLLAENAG